MNNVDRQRLGRAWNDTGLGEHASVAAFSRFVLHLMSLGAPPELLLDAIQAMKDEVEHAMICFGIARQFTAQPAGPGRMDISNVFEQRADPESILAAAIVEGCFEETISAECARVAMDRTRDSGIRDALRRIVVDEARHADLSWRFAAWMLQQYPELRPTAEVCFASVLQSRYKRREEGEDLVVPDGYGILLPGDKKQVEESTLREVIGPRAKSLLGDSFKNLDDFSRALAQCTIV